MISVVLAEDQALVLGALAALLSLESDITIVARVGDGEAALDAVRTHRPDILLSDIEMPKLTGLDVAEALTREKASTKACVDALVFASAFSVCLAGSVRCGRVSGFWCSLSTTASHDGVRDQVHIVPACFDAPTFALSILIVFPKLLRHTPCCTCPDRLCLTTDLQCL